MATLANKPEPEHNWYTLGACLAFFPYIPHDEAPLQCAWTLGATCKETQDNFKRAEAPFVSQIEEVIRTFCETGSATTPSDAVAYFFGLRPIVIECFFARFSIRKNSSTHLTIIPYPLLPTKRVLEWFLIDWWQEWGISEICLQRYSDEFHLGE